MPLEPAAISYVFTQLELYGDFVVSAINKSFFTARNAPKNWHSRIHGDADIKDAAKLLRMRRALAAPFRMETDDIPLFTVAKSRIEQIEQNTLILFTVGQVGKRTLQNGTGDGIEPCKLGREIRYILVEL